MIALDIKLNTIGEVDFTKGTITLPMDEWEKWESDKRKLAELINYMQDQLKAWDANHGKSKHYVIMNNEGLIVAECDDNTLLEQAIIVAKKDLYDEHKKVEEKIAALEQMTISYHQAKEELGKIKSELEYTKSELTIIESNCSKVKDIIIELRSRWYLRFLYNTFTKILNILL